MTTEERLQKYRDALDPTKTRESYHRRFGFNVPDFDDAGGRTQRCVEIPWPKMREIMAFIKQRAEL